MLKLLPIINDMIVIIFDLLFYSLMFPIRENKRCARVGIYVGCAVIVMAYFTSTYILCLPAAVSSAACMSVPSFLLFLYFAKYRDSRFVLTFCFIDTVSLIVAFIGRFIGIMLKHGEIYAIIIMLVLFVTLLRLAMAYFAKYRKLLEEADTGWGLMALATALIYFAMVFFAGYPKPMIERLEYVPIWFVFAIVVLSCYTVFIHSILKTQKISEQKKRLEKEKEIYHKAYNDGLTGLYNRASYTEKVNELERRRKEYKNLSMIVIDINEFKTVNDTRGHYVGDKVLVAVADSLRKAFADFEEYIFRMGGDEFLVILQDESQEQIQRNIETFRQFLVEESQRLGFEVTVAVGYKMLAPEEKGRLESAYILADKSMYMDKKKFQKKNKEAQIIQ